MSGLDRRQSLAPPDVQPVAASHAIAGVLQGPPRPVRVLAAFPAAVYLEHEEGIVALVASDGVHQPNALVLTRPATRRPMAGLNVARRGEIGQGTLWIAGRRVMVTRWFDPLPRVAGVDATTLAHRVAAARRELAAATGPAPTELTDPLAAVIAAVRAEDRPGAVTAARRLIGLGPGLTPAGDDVLAGLFAGSIALLPAVSDAPTSSSPRDVRAIGEAVADVARTATTTISAALLVHAARGEVAAPAAAVLHALTGNAAMAPALRRLFAVGASSGRDLALGLLAAGELVLTGHSTPAHPLVPTPATM